MIPNFFDVDDFLPADDLLNVKEPLPFLLYLGRVTQRKGPSIAGEISKRLGMPLILAGPGATQAPGGPVVGEGCTVEGNVRYLGEVGKKIRAELLARASCLLVPTIYNEPFGGVAAEAMISGCPVVASDWGAFTETVTPSVGRRFRTLGQGAQAVREALTLDRRAIADEARGLYSLEAVRPRFRAWFDQLETLWGEGWYA